MGGLWGGKKGFGKIVFTGSKIAEKSLCNTQKMPTFAAEIEKHAHFEANGQ